MSRPDSTPLAAVESRSVKSCWVVWLLVILWGGVSWQGVVIVVGRGV